MRLPHGNGGGCRGPLHQLYRDCYGLAESLVCPTLEREYDKDFRGPLVSFADNGATPAGVADIAHRRQLAVGPSDRVVVDFSDRCQLADAGQLLACREITGLHLIGNLIHNLLIPARRVAAVKVFADYIFHCRLEERKEKQ